MLDTLIAGQMSPGEKASEFEKKFAAYVCGESGVLVNSGTDALRIALLAMKELYGWDEGDEVIVPALTFVATVNIVLQAGLRPVFVDVEDVNSETPYCMDTAYGVGNAITPKTRCILPVHLFGCAAFSERSPLSGHLNNVIHLLEDSCESLAAPLFGEVSCFSFYVCHLLNLGVGGMAVTSDRKLEKLMRSYANHGRDPRFLGTRLSKAPQNLSDRFAFERLGYSSRATEMQAALGLVQLETIGWKLERRRHNALQLCAKLKGLALNLPRYPERLSAHSWMMFPVVVNSDVDVQRVCLDLEAQGIETRPLMPLLTQPLYRRLFPGEYQKHKNALRFATRGFYIGCHEFMTSEDIDYMAEVFKSIFKKTLTPRAFRPITN